MENTNLVSISIQLNMINQHIISKYQLIFGQKRRNVSIALDPSLKFVKRVTSFVTSRILLSVWCMAEGNIGIVDSALMYGKRSNFHNCIVSNNSAAKRDGLLQGPSECE